MPLKLVSVTEDQVILGRNLKEAAEDRGFAAFHAESAEATLAQIDALGRCPDVMIIDQNLNGTIDGPELARTMRKRFPGHGPEIIVYTAYDDQKYVREAFRSYAAVLLRKSVDNWRSVLVHVRVLAARRGFFANTAAQLQHVRGLARKFRHTPRVLQAVVETFLPPELEALGLPVALLSGYDQQFFCRGSIEGLPEQHPGYGALAAELFDAPARRPTAFQDLTAPAAWDTDGSADALHAFAETTLVPLWQSPHLTLVLVLQAGTSRQAPDPEQTAELVGDYFRGDLFGTFFASAAAACEAEIGKQAMLRAAARFTYYMGKKQLDTYTRGVNRNELRADAVFLPQLKQIGSDLLEIGDLLGTMDEDDQEHTAIDIDQLIHATQKAGPTAGGLPPFTLEGSARVLARRAHLHQAVKRIMHWFEARDAALTITCTPVAADWTRISFCDNHPRLPKDLRRDIFHPFPAVGSEHGLQHWMALFIAKMLVESLDAGRLEEAGDDLPCDRGNRIDLYLPTAVAP